MFYKRFLALTHRLLLPFCYYVVNEAAALLEEQEPDEQQQRTPHDSNTHALARRRSSFCGGGKNAAELKTCGGLNRRAFDPGQYLLFRVSWNEGGNFET